MKKVKEGIVTKDGNCPVTPLLVMLQGRWKSQLMYEMCIYDTVRFGQLKKSIPTNPAPIGHFWMPKSITIPRHEPIRKVYVEMVREVVEEESLHEND